MLKFRIESFLLDSGKPRSTLMKAILGWTNANAANAAKIANGVITRVSNDCLGLTWGETV
jgi:hypothetical protein